MNLSKIKIGDKAPEIFNVIIEIPKDSQNKYEIDKESGAIKLDRVLYSPMHYPADYGFIPETHCEDGDPLDVIVLGSDPLFPGCVVEARPIALMRMKDNGEEDSKILAVQAKNPRFNDIKGTKDIQEHSLKEIAHFFAAYKELENKKVEVIGWESEQAAKEEIKKSQEAYKNL